MKNEALVMEINENSMIVMTCDSDFLEVPRPEKTPRIGEYIELDQCKKKSFFSMRFMNMAAMIVLILLVGLTTNIIFSQPSAVVALDINPSVEFNLNKEGIVEKVISLNEEARSLLEKYDFCGMSIETCLNEFVQKCIDEEILSSVSNNVIVISYVDKSDVHSEECKDIEKNITNLLTENFIESDIVVEDTSFEEWQEAKKKDISVNKFKVINNLPSDSKQEIKNPQEKSIKTMLQESNMELKKVFKETKHVFKKEKKKDLENNSIDSILMNKALPIITKSQTARIGKNDTSNKGNKIKDNRGKGNEMKDNHGKSNKDKDKPGRGNNKEKHNNGNRNHGRGSKYYPKDWQISKDKRGS